MYVWRGRAGHSMTISNSAECWKNRTGARGQACGACACLITHTPPACLSAPLSTSSTLPTPPPAPPCRVTLVLHLPPHLHFSIFHPHSLSDPAFIPLLSCRVTPVHHTPHPFTLVPPPSCRVTLILEFKAGKEEEEAAKRMDEVGSVDGSVDEEAAKRMDEVTCLRGGACGHLCVLHWGMCVLPGGLVVLPGGLVALSVGLDVLGQSSDQAHGWGGLEALDTWRHG